MKKQIVLLLTAAALIFGCSLALFTVKNFVITGIYLIFVGVVISLWRDI